MFSTTEIDSPELMKCNDPGREVVNPTGKLRVRVYPRVVYSSSYGVGIYANTNKSFLKRLTVLITKYSAFYNTSHFECTLQSTMGARITHLHLCCTTNQRLTTTNSINCDEATFQASRIVKLSKTNSMYRHDCHVTSIQMSTATTHASTTLVFLILSYSNVYISVQALFKHVRV